MPASSLFNGTQSQPQDQHTPAAEGPCGASRQVYPRPAPPTPGQQQAQRTPLRKQPSPEGCSAHLLNHLQHDTGYRYIPVVLSTQERFWKGRDPGDPTSQEASNHAKGARQRLDKAQPPLKCVAGLLQYCTCMPCQDRGANTPLSWQETDVVMMPLLSFIISMA